ncbi:MAG: ATP-binding cassette domain-containing protein [Candidatus Omnitrophota bacterium]|jgi:zinc transport system ATP-binding protein|nr:MAG: ATP-binding cassette domain-containing protein [Candidatus Omnitrophota bacterium]
MTEQPLSHLRSLIRADVNYAPAVCMNNIAVSLNGREVLFDIDLCLEEGGFLGIIGSSGSGKTTLLNVILGLISPTEGSIEVFGGAPNARMRRAIPIGYVPQIQTIPPFFPATVFDMVLMGAYGTRRIGLPIKNEYKSHALSLLAQMKLEHLIDHPIGRLSEGERQQVWLARALVVRPRLLLLDEPFRGVDASGKRCFFNLLFDLKEQFNLTVVMVSHEIDLLTRFSHRIACLNKTIHWHDRSEWRNRDRINHGYKCELKNHLDFEKRMKETDTKLFADSSDPSIHHHI